MYIETQTLRIGLMLSLMANWLMEQNLTLKPCKSQKDWVQKTILLFSQVNNQNDYDIRLTSLSTLANSVLYDAQIYHKQRLMN